jgi:hypothetical protein
MNHLITNYRGNTWWYSVEIGKQAYFFAEGFGMHANPYFKNLPLDGTKGESYL